MLDQSVKKLNGTSLTGGAISVSRKGDKRPVLVWTEGTHAVFSFRCARKAKITNRSRETANVNCIFDVRLDRTRSFIPYCNRTVSISSHAIRAKVYVVIRLLCRMAGGHKTTVIIFERIQLKISEKRKIYTGYTYIISQR